MDSSSVSTSSSTSPSSVGRATAGRRALLSAGAAAALSALAASSPLAAGASVAPPPPPTLAGRIGGALPLPLPMPLGGPEPVAFPRKRLDLRFAVLLMRSSYDAVDALDFVSMEKFQIQFWKLRQSEVEQYTLQYKPLRFKPGDLTDPLYFDFISYAQYATITRAMRAPQQVFEERYSCDSLPTDAPDGDGDDACEETLTRVVRRPAAYADDSLLPSFFSDAAGERIYRGLVDGFRGEQFGGPAPAAPSGGAGLGPGVVAGVKKILGIFQDRGYCLDTEVYDIIEDDGAGGGSFAVKVTGPVTLWGLEALANQRALVANTHDAMAVAAYLRACGLAAVRELELTEAGYVSRWRVGAAAAA